MSRQDELLKIAALIARQAETATALTKKSFKTRAERYRLEAQRAAAARARPIHRREDVILRRNQTLESAE
jgi:hypothetical protein